MKNSQKGFVVPLLIAIIAVLVIGGGIYIYENKKVEVPVVVDNTTQQPDQVQQTNSQIPSVTKGTNNYSFKSIDKGKAKTGPYDDYSVEIYKNNKLVSTVDVSDDVEVHDTIDYTMIEPTLFVVSPDQKYVAFKSAVWGGSCVGIEKPMVISLNDFSIKKFDRSGIDDKYGSEQKLVSLRWISNDTVQASMIFGDKDIGGCSNGKEVITDINFIVESKNTQGSGTAKLKTYTDNVFSFQYPASAKVIDDCCQGGMIRDLRISYPSTETNAVNGIDYNKSVGIQMYSKDSIDYSNATERMTPIDSIIKSNNYMAHIWVSDSGYTDIYKIISSTFKLLH